jgi:transcriptional regulator with XRE-family HTH domain
MVVVFDHRSERAINLAKAPHGRAAPREPGADPIDVEVGQNLRRGRLARGHTQSALGAALGISFQQVQKYERGSNRLSASMLVKAARFLRVSAADLLPPDDQTQALPDLAPRLAEVPGAADIANAYCALRSAELRRALLKLTKTLNAMTDEDAGASAVDTGADPR